LSSDGSDVDIENKISNPEGRVDPGKVQFSSRAAKAFLAQSKFYQFIHINFIILLCFIETMHGLVVSCSI